MSHETAPRGHESKGESLSPNEVTRHNERLREHVERGAEKAGEHSSAELEARREVAHEALPTAEYESTNNESASQKDTPTPTRQEKKRGFNTTMHHVRKELSPVEQNLSKVIHQPTVEKISEIGAKTVARPSGILGAASFGLIGLMLLFGIAKYVGFELSGSEMPLLLIIGFAVGLFVEWTYKSLRALFARNTADS